MAKSLVSRIEGIERDVILRYARVLPFLLGVVAVLGTALAAAAYFFALVPPLKPGDPTRPDPPPAVVVSVADVTTYLQGSRALPVQRESAPSSTTPTPEPQPAAEAKVASNTDAMAIATKLNDLRLLATEHKLSWAGDSRSGGVGPVTLAVLRAYDTGRSRDTVQPPGSDESYMVNSSNVQTKLALLEEVSLVVKTVPNVDLAAVEAWAALRRSRESERLAAISRAEQQMAAEKVSNETAYQNSVSSRLVIKAKSIVVVGAGLAGLLIAALLLAVLATERNTRALERLLSGMPNRPEPKETP